MESRFGVRGSTAAPKASLRSGARRLPLRLVVQAENSGLGTLPMPKAAESPLTLRFLLLPPCFPGFRAGVGEAKNGPEGPF